MNSHVFITTFNNYPTFFYLYSYSLLPLLCYFKENLIHHVIPPSIYAYHWAGKNR